MNPGEHDRLYNLLPALYRKVDEQQGAPLRALLSVLQEEIDRLEEDMRAQYDNWFIETCDRWAIPYIADLVGVRGLVDPQQLFDGQRRRVANALRYRRRKGTLAVLRTRAAGRVRLACARGGILSLPGYDPARGPPATRCRPDLRCAQWADAGRSGHAV